MYAEADCAAEALLWLEDYIRLLKLMTASREVGIYRSSVLVRKSFGPVSANMRGLSAAEAVSNWE